MSDAFEWKLSRRQDGYGFYYGEARRGDKKVRLDVMPPEPLWDGDMRMDAYPPDPKAWIVCMDGNEVARVESERDLSEVGRQMLLGGWRQPARQTVLDRVRAGALRLLGVSKP